MSKREQEVLFDFYNGELDYNEETYEVIERLRAKGLLDAKEVWAKIEEAPNYYVSTLGRVKNKKGKILKTYSYKGYQRLKLQVDGTAKDFRVHRLVAKAFLPNPDQLPQINHIDEDKANNCVWNLEWCDSYYNNNYGSKVTPVVQIKDGEVVGEYRSLTEAAEATGFYVPNICRAVHGQIKSYMGCVWRKKEE